MSMTQLSRQEMPQASAGPLPMDDEIPSWRPVAGETAVDACERAVRRWIVTGQIQPGDRLPPERLLATQLGVNRTTLRGALGRLASARLLSVRQGSGYIVQDYRRVAGVELLPEIAACTEDFDVLVRDLLEIRRRLARMVIERMSAHAQPSDIQAIALAIDHFAEIVASGAPAESVADADQEVDAAILAATASPVLGLCLNPVSCVVRDLEPLRDAIYADPDAQVAAYRTLLRCLESPSSEAVADLEAELEERDRAALARITRASA